MVEWIIPVIGLLLVGAVLATLIMQVALYIHYDRNGRGKKR